MTEYSFILFYNANNILQVKQVCATKQISDSIPNTCIHTYLYVTFDIAYYMVILRKEGSSGHWYYHCGLAKYIWKEAKYNYGILWRSDTLKAISYTGKVVPTAKEVNKYPLWNFIIVHNFITSVLYISMETMSMAIKQLMDVVDTWMENESTYLRKIVTQDLSDQRNEWEYGKRGKHLCTLVAR